MLIDAHMYVGICAAVSGFDSAKGDEVFLSFCSGKTWVLPTFVSKFGTEQCNIFILF